MKKNKLWSISRPLTLIIVGIINTILIRQEDLGTWKNYLGYALLIAGIIDMLFLVNQHFKKRKNIG